jgi:HEAT repeat protein
MTADMRSLVIGLATLALVGSSAVRAQTPRPVTDATTISRGWAALAAGRLTEAVSLADGVLKKRPRSHSALTLKLEALSAGAKPLAALDAYEAWVAKGGRNVDDRGLLQPIATGVLRALSTDPDPAIRNTALRFLAADGDETASATLRKLRGDGDQRATLALVADGDANAIAMLQSFAGSANGRDVSTSIKALGEHGGLTPALIQTFAKDRVPMNRAAVAEALAASKDPTTAQILETLSRDPDPLVHTSVVLARARAGDEGALANARAMLASEVPDIRLTAAEALVGAFPREAAQAVQSLLTDPDGLNRFRAASVIGRFDPAAVQFVIAEGLAHQSPLIQQEAARVAAETLSADLAMLRQLLRHPDRAIVVQAAGAIVVN